MPGGMMGPKAAPRRPGQVHTNQRASTGHRLHPRRGQRTTRELGGHVRPRAPILPPPATHLLTIGNLNGDEAAQ